MTADDEVLFSEVSPRPHDTGMVTLVSQPTSEFALHVRAVLGLPVRPDDLVVRTPSASAVVLGTTEGVPSYTGLAEALAGETVQLRVFGKPVSRPGRRMAVALAQGDTVEQARERARRRGGRHRRGRVTVSRSAAPAAPAATGGRAGPSAPAR